MQNQFTIRAMPAMGFSHRWCAHRPWGKAAITVSVVEVDVPRFVDASGETLPRYATGRNEDGKVIYAYGDNITVDDLEELRRDPYISVSITGAADGDPLELNSAKAELLRMQRENEQLRKELQAEVEQAKAYRAGAQKAIDEAGAKAAQSDQQLATAQAQLTAKAKK